MTLNDPPLRAELASAAYPQAGGGRPPGASSQGDLPMTSSSTASTLFPKLDLQKWIADNREHLKPPVANKQLFTGADDVIVFVSGGPNTRNDFHVNPTEELFYQLKGDIAVRVRPLDGSPPRDEIIREGE